MSRQRREVSLTKSKEMNEKEMYEIRYHFFRSRHIKEIILAMNPKSYDENKPEYANAISFFRSISTKADEMARLQKQLNTYLDQSMNNNLKDILTEVLVFTSFIAT